MFARFFKPKWQHRNQAKRIEAATELALGDPALTTLATQDKVPEVRAVAAGRLRDVATLQAIVSSEKDDRVLQQAYSRLRDLLCGVAEDAPPLTERLQVLGKGYSNELIEHIAHHGKESALRRQVLSSITSPALLSEIATGDPAIDVRVCAVELIHDIAALERVLKASRKSDKRVTRLARQSLTELRARTEKNQRALALCNELEARCKEGAFAARQSFLIKAERQWPELREVVDEDRRERLKHALSQLREICDQYRSIKSTKQKAFQTLEDIIPELEHEQEFTAELQARTQQALSEADQYWNTAAALDPADEHITFNRYRQAAGIVMEHQNRLHKNTEAARRIREFLDELEAGAEAARFSTKKAIVKFRERWEGLPKPRSKTLHQALSARFNQLHDRIEQQKNRAAETAKQLEQTINELLERLHNAAESGQLNKAISLRDQIRHRLDNAVGLAKAKRSSLEQALKNTFPRIKELQGWRNWGASGVRERLCERAEGLLETECTPHEQAAQIRKLREAWQRLDRQSRPAGESIWNRFNCACNKAYEPCRIAFDEETKQRAENLHQKQEICQEMEDLYQHTDWAQVEWKELIKDYNKLRQSWRQIGPVSRAKGRELSKRLNKVTRNIESKLDTRRQAGLQLRKELIERIQQLSEQTELDEAIAQTKRAQSEWNKVIVRSTRRTEQELWKAFRSACDQVFERRNVEQQAKRRAQEEHLEHRVERCETLEKLTRDLTQDNLEQTSHQIEQLKTDWQKIMELPRTERTGLEQRFKEALKAYSLKTDTIKSHQTRELWNALQERGRLCARLEAYLERPATPPADLEEIKTSWQTQPELETNQISEVKTRFEISLAAIEGDALTAEYTARNLRENTEQKRLQCLEMEVRAGMESPPEDAEQRMQLKVSRLSERFDGQNAKSLKDNHEIVLSAQQQWIASGMLPADEMQALEQRFTAAAEALLGGDTQTES
ncbi:MAG: DUF349 domain-containing protein [Pseudomonadota bacterium]